MGTVPHKMVRLERMSDYRGSTVPCLLNAVLFPIDSWSGLLHTFGMGMNCILCVYYVCIFVCILC